MELKAVFFDLDGTLVDSGRDIVNALESAYRSTVCINVKIPISIIGPPLSEMIESLTPCILPEQRNALIEAFRNIYDNSTLSATQLYRGISEILSLLHKTGRDLFIVTNKPINTSLRIIRKLKIEHISEVSTSNSIPGRLRSKEEIVADLLTTHRLAASVVAVVGDGESDIRAAQANGVTAIAVSYGYGKEEDLIGCQPDFIAKTPRELLKIIKVL